MSALQNMQKEAKLFKGTLNCIKNENLLIYTSTKCSPVGLVVLLVRYIACSSWSDDIELFPSIIYVNPLPPV